MQPVERLPKFVDWRTKGIVTAVKDQGHCGSCWAFASTAVIESHVAKNSGLLFDLSVQQMAMCAPNPNKCGGTGGCAGSTAEIAFDYVSKSTGLYQEYQYSYASYYGSDYACTIPTTGAPVATIGGFVKLPENNYTALMNAVAQLGPIAISVDASTFGAYKSGIHDGCNQVNPDINHAVVLMGYGNEAGKDYWLVRNSWAPGYGEKGYIKVLRTSDEEGRCGMDVTPHDGSACEGEDDAVKVCGTCGILYDTAYPLGAKAL
jgi:cathepsin L